MAFLSFRQVCKRFPGVTALEDVTLDVALGSCHALMGENGAGKSTLGRILAGICQPDSGEIRIDNEVIHPVSPVAARRLGIAMVHQELAFCSNLTVAENLCLGDLPSRAGWLERRAMTDRAEAMLSEVESSIAADTPMADLSTGEEQLVQIAAALGVGARVIVMDEPTSSLSAGESEHLFHLLARLKQRGITVIYVSHRMDEIFRLCDTITVLRDGRHIATESTVNTSRDRVIEQMIGRSITHRASYSLRQAKSTLLSVKNLSSQGKFRDVSLEIRGGEIVGMAGLIGAGRSEVAQAIFGFDTAARGSVMVEGVPLERGSVGAAMRAGIGYLPEDRKRQALVLTMNVRENASLAALSRFTRVGFVRRSEEGGAVEQFANRLRIKTPSLETPIAALSGGNQQKVALAKWLARQCKVLIVDEPTRGVDVGAKVEIHQLLDELACEGIGILLISSELPEVMALSQRILVMREGLAVGWLERDEFSQDRLLRMMSGLADQVPEPVRQ